MDLNAVRMFVQVAQAGSLSAAAARMQLPLPTLSRRIRDLERQLNVQLLERSARGARPPRSLKARRPTATSGRRRRPTPRRPRPLSRRSRK